jgi:nicotinamidase-related amidase
MKTSIVSVDFQNDFAMPTGLHYRPRACVDFKETLRPYLGSRHMRAAEIISDYRHPRPVLPPSVAACCQPGEWGYESALPADVKDPRRWIKCLNSPVWVRENIGDATRPPGAPYPDPAAFTRWARVVAGEPDQATVVLIGLTLDYCVLCTAQEFRFRGYDIRVLMEGVDTYEGTAEEKDTLLASVVQNWAKAITFDELKHLL